MEANLRGNNTEYLIMTYLTEGQNLFENNKIKDAFDLFDKALKLNREYPYTHLIKGEALLSMLNVEEAEKHIKKYLKSDPFSPRAWKDMMELYYERGEWKNSLLYCSKLLEADTFNAELYAKKAYLLGVMGDADTAIVFYDKAIGLKPDFYTALCDKGQLLKECNCHDESLEAYLQAIKANPAKGEAYMGAAFGYNKLGDIKMAREFSKKACELDPENDFFACHRHVMSCI